MLQKYFAPKTTNFECEKCENTKVNLTPKLINSPKVLILHLKRFRFTKNENSLFESRKITKLSRPVKMNLKISLFDYGKSGEEEKENSAAKEIVFELKSVILHKGKSHESGHYVTDVFDDERRKWFLCDDEMKTKISESDLGSDEQQSACYILFYQRQQ